MRAVIWLDSLTILEGIGTLFWLTAHPSEFGSRIFLAYSLERWLLILVATATIAVFSYALWVIKYKTERVETLIDFFEKPKHASRLLVSITILFILFSGLMFWLPRVDAVQPYFVRLFPLLLWSTAILAQIWLFLMVVMRGTVVQFLRDFFPVESKKQFYPVKTMGKSLLIVLTLISLGYLIVQFKSYFSVRESILIGDSWSYLQGAALDISDSNFFSERRPWAILLFYKILGSSQSLIEICQLSISTAAWLFLAWKFIGSIKNDWIKIAGFLVILGFSLTPTVQVWNHAVLSESLSISVMVLILALFIGLAQKWEWRALFLLVLYFVLWMSFREANSYIALMVALALAIIGLAKRTLRVYLLLSFLIGVTFFVNYQLSAIYALPRWALPLAEVITIRILPDQEYLDFFANEGMPVNPALMAFSGRWANSDEYAIVNSVELAKFEKWLFTEGRNVYVKFLLTHPRYTIEAPLKNMDVLLADDFVEGIPVLGYLPALPTIIDEILYPKQYFQLYLWVSIFAIGFIFATSLRQKLQVNWVVFVFLFLAIPHLYLVWHGDALDIARHAVMGNIQFRLGIWLLLVLFIDSLFMNRQQVQRLELSVR
ncbi:MAG: hypothetical protein PVJ21_09180 [Anaerolineales bacterium]|jgi:hypothetical protein